MAKLIVQSGSDIGQSVTVTDKVVVGRLQTCDLPIQEGQASRQHFQVEKIGESFQITDMGSRNGTVVDGVDIKGARILSNGDVIVVGDTQVGFVLDQPGFANGEPLEDIVITSKAVPTGYGYLYFGLQSSMNREVCIDALAADYPKNGEVWTRFVDMHKKSSGFDNPNILGVYSISEDKYAYSVRPAFHGNTLRSVAKASTLTLSLAMKVLFQVADALSYVHARGKFHGRLSPSTIVVDEAFRVKVVGFGAEPRGLVTDPALPEAAWHAAFCSPEVGRGLAGTPSADIYSLGTVAYWLISGKSPVNGADAMEILRNHASSAPITPLSNHLPELPAQLVSAVHRLLKKAPGERPQDASAAKALLQSAWEAAQQGGAPVPAPAKLVSAPPAPAKPSPTPRGSAHRRAAAAKSPTASTSARRRSPGPTSSGRAASRTAKSSGTIRDRKPRGLDREDRPRRMARPAPATTSWPVGLGLVGFIYFMTYVVTRLALAKMG